MTQRHLAIICGVLDTHRPASLHSVALAADLVEAGYAVTLFAISADYVKTDPRVRVVAAGSRPRVQAIAMLRYGPWLRRAVANAKPDATVSLISTIPASILAPLNGTRHSYRDAKADPAQSAACRWVHAAKSLRPGAMLTRSLERRALSSRVAHTYLAITEPIREQIKRALAEHPPRTAAPAIELVRLPQMPTQREMQSVRRDAPKTREQLARAFGLSDASYWIAFPFTDAAADGFECAVRAFKPLIEQGVDAVLLLAGPTRYTHLAWLSQLGLRDRVRLVGQTDAPQSLFSACDLIINPTHHDPAGWALRPAQGLGRPVITTEASGVAELFDEGHRVVLTGPIEPQALLDAIRQRHSDWLNESNPRLTPPQNPPSDRPTLAQAIDRRLRDLGPGGK